MKRQHTVVLIAILVAGFVLSGCATSGLGVTTVVGSGQLRTEERAVSGFSRISLAGQGDLVVQVGEQEALTIEAEDNLLPEITTEVRGQELVIETKPGVNLQPKQPIRYTLTVKALERVSLSGSGSIQIQPLQSGSMTINLSGSGDINLAQLQTGSLAVTITGSGSVSVRGTADSLTVTISGSGQLNLADLQAKSAQVMISGSGDTTLWVTQSLNVTIPGSGTVRFYGSPSVTKTISGSGNVSRLGNK